MTRKWGYREASRSRSKLAGLIDMAFTFSIQSASARRVTAILVLAETYFVEL